MCGDPPSRYTCRATCVAADFLRTLGLNRCSSSIALHPLKGPVAPVSEHGGCLQQNCLGKLLIFWDGFLSALCSALAACEAPFPRLCFPLASGFVLTSLTTPPPAALPVHSSSHADSFRELHILRQRSLARVPPLCGFTICHIDFLQ